MIANSSVSARLDIDVSRRRPNDNDGALGRPSLREAIFTQSTPRATVTPSPSLRQVHRYAKHIVTSLHEVHRCAKSVVTRSTSLRKTHRATVTRVHRYAESIV